MAMLNRNIMGNAAAVRAGARRLLRQAREDVSSVLLVVGFVTCVTVVLAASSRSWPAESLHANPIYLGAVLGAFFGGLATMWAALWVADDAARRRATGRIILGASMVPMVIAFGLGSATTPTAASTSFAL